MDLIEGRRYVLTDEGKQTYEEIIKRARAAAAEGMNNSDATKQLVEIFPEFSKEISTFMKNNYDDLVIAMKAIEYQEELIDNRMNTAMTEWISVLGNLTNHPATEF